MRQENKLYRSISYAIILISILEIIFIGSIYITAPPLPPEISPYDYDEDELAEQAGEIYKDYFPYPPHFSKNFHYEFFFVKLQCKSIYKKSYSAINKLEAYNDGIKILKKEFSRVFFMLLIIFLICSIASFSILNNKLVFLSSCIIVAFSLLPLFSSFLIGFQMEFLFYWTIPSLLLGLIIFFPQLIKLFFDSPRSVKFVYSIFYGSPIREIIRGLFILTIGVGLTVGLISAAAEMGLNRITIGAPVSLALYGLFLILRAGFRIIKKPFSHRKLGSIIKPVVYEKKMGFNCPGCNNISLKIVKSIELGSDSRSDEYSLQAIECEKCTLVGVSTYQESRRGAQESWEHIGYKMENSHYQEFFKLLNQCNNPTDSKCSCEAHIYFGVNNNYATLKPLDKLKLENYPFSMENHK